MIKNIADFARSIYRKDFPSIQEALDSLTHPGTIGDIYEGTTLKIINQVIGNIPDIKVCEGFIKNYRTGQISPQTDAIIYFGEEEIIQNTTHKIVPIDNVIAMIEVKKNLGFEELYDFYDKQGKVYEICDNLTPFDKELFCQIKQSVFGQLDFNEDDAKDKSKLHFYLYNILKVENAEPLRICLGYYGFKKEKTLRDNLIKVIDKRNKNNLPHTGMNSLPSLIVAENNCLIKMIGSPWTCAFSDPFHILESTRCDGLYILIKALSSKIESKTNVRFNYDLDDYSSISMNSFLMASINEENNDSTQYYMEEGQISGFSSIKPYCPVEISDYEYIVISELCNLSYDQSPRIKIDDQLFGGHNLEVDLQNLLKFRIVAFNDGYVELITISCSCGIWDGKFYVGENCSGQFDKWMMEKIK